MSPELDLVDRRLLNVLQSSFPLVEEPFDDMGDKLGIPASDALDRARVLKDRNIVRRISAIFDTRRLGYKSALAAMRVPPGDVDAAARTINEHPGVSHNYARNGPFDLWFTLAVPGSESVEDTIEHIAQRVGAEDCRVLPAVRRFKIGVNFDVVKEESAAGEWHDPNGHNRSHDESWKRAESLTGFEIEAIRELQEDLSLEPHPFAPMAERLDVSQRKLFGVARSFAERGIMRRYGAVLDHRRVGFEANALSVWRVPSERSVEAGNLMAGSAWVTHCFQRPAFPDWPYTHYAMIHATSRQTCEDAARAISEATGITDYALLYSTREYKKTRARYFV